MSFYSSTEQMLLTVHASVCIIIVIKEAYISGSCDITIILAIMRC